jgi:hypothetical protein
MKSRMGIVVVFAVLAAEGGASRVPAATITQWNFGTTHGAPFNSPPPDVGPGVATVLGMDSSYTFSSGNTITGTGTFTYTTLFSIGSSAFADILATPGDPNGLANAWRVRGPNNAANQPPGNGNGWALQAAQDTQGAQFSVSTVGFTGIKFHFDWFTTTQGVNKMQEQYTLDGTNWININGLLTATSNGFAPTQTIDFSVIPGANNDPNFGVRLVSAFDPALSPLNYGSADGGQAGVYNNNSGNWRFADVGFTGTLAAVPEPSSLLLGLVAGGFGLAYARRRRGGRAARG